MRSDIDTSQLTALIQETVENPNSKLKAFVKDEQHFKQCCPKEDFPHLCNEFSDYSDQLVEIVLQSKQLYAYYFEDVDHIIYFNQYEKSKQYREQIFNHLLRSPEDFVRICGNKTESNAYQIIKLIQAFPEKKDEVLQHILNLTEKNFFAICGTKYDFQILIKHYPEYTDGFGERVLNSTLPYFLAIVCSDINLLANYLVMFAQQQQQLADRAKDHFDFNDGNVDTSLETLPHTPGISLEIVEQFRNKMLQGIYHRIPTTARDNNNSTTTENINMLHKG